MFGRRGAGRRTSLSGYSRKESSPRTPDLLYIALIILCAGGVWYTRDAGVRSLSGHVLNAYNDEPIDGATLVVHGDPKAVKVSGLPADATTGSTAGYYQFGEVPTALNLSASADGFISSAPVMLNLKLTGKEGMNYDIRLVPTTLHGIIKDPNGKPIGNALVSLSTPGGKPQVVTTKDDGLYAYKDVPVDSQIMVKAAGYRRAAFALHRVDRRDITLEPFQVKGIYMNAFTAADDGDFASTLSVIDKSDLNTVVIDIKNFIGNVFYPSTVPGTQPVNPDKGLIADLKGRIQTLHQHGVYTIARIVVFQDSILSVSHPDWAIKSKKGGVWHDGGNVGWANPYNKDVWAYNLAIAKEVADLGFDEVQFDTIHFPPSGDLSDADYGQKSDATSRVAAIHDFLKQAMDMLSPQGVFVSADLFGLTTIDGTDIGIGQSLKDLAPVVDYISPILYPSQWGPGSFNLDRPADHPGDVVYNSLDQANRRLAGTSAHLRPWLQDFTLNQPKYGEKEVRDQITSVAKGVSAATGWLLWNPNSNYTVAALGKSTTKPAIPGTLDAPTPADKDTPPLTPISTISTTPAVPTVTATP